MAPVASAAMTGMPHAIDFERHVAERLGDRRIEQEVGARNRTCKVVTGQLPREDCVRKLLL